MTREEVIAVIRNAAEELGRVPTFTQLLEMKRLSQYDIRKNFGVYASALQACGLEGQGSGYETDVCRSFLPTGPRWHDAQGRVPTVGDYELHSRYSLKPLMRQFGAWPRVAAGMAQYARENGLEPDGKDVLEVVAAHLEGTEKATWEFKVETRRGFCGLD